MISYLRVLYHNYSKEYPNKYNNYYTDINNDYYINGLKLAENNKYFDLTIEGNIEYGDILYLVYGKYETGDSFHRETGRIEFVDVFRDRQNAYGCKRELENHYNKHKIGIYEEDHYCQLKRENGTLYQYSIPWHGYFERLNFIEVNFIEVVELLVE
ncbi:MAG: hypothetical protein KC589_10315 [Nanoarchaeota archaeon]|nr:hypothetical protein [Nanoarchaeota archaeon]